jgi:hypothetical protein
MLKQVNGKWALVSKKTLRPLAYYKGEGKPSEEWVRKQEARIQYFKHGVDEAVSPDILPTSGAGQDGTDTLVKSYQRDTPGQGGDVKRHPLRSFKDYLNK